MVLSTRTTIAVQLVFIMLMNDFGSSHPRTKRALFSLFSDQKNSDYNTGNHSPIIVGGGMNTASTSSPVDSISKTLRENAEHFTQSATDLIKAPFEWIAHMKLYGPFYAICFIVILAMVVYLYCVCQRIIFSYPVDPMPYRTMIPTMMNFLSRSHTQHERAIHV